MNRGSPHRMDTTCGGDVFSSLKTVAENALGAQCFAACTSYNQHSCEIALSPYPHIIVDGVICVVPHESLENSVSTT